MRPVIPACRVTSKLPQVRKGGLDHCNKILDRLLTADNDRTNGIWLGEKAPERFRSRSGWVRNKLSSVTWNPPGYWRSAPSCAERHGCNRITGSVPQRDCFDRNTNELIVVSFPKMALPSGQARPDQEPLRVNDRVESCLDLASRPNEEKTTIRLFCSLGLLRGADRSALAARISQL